MGGLVHNHAAVYSPRQEWLDREVTPRGLDREGPEEIFADLDAYFEQIAADHIAAQSKGD